jgi:4-amino-4-deoxy-L-arabinose transferase-like glycosyltransferase
MKPNLYLVGLAIVLLLGLSMAYALYSGPYYAFDDLNYLTYAHQMLIGSFSISQSPYAYGYLLPAIIAASFYVFGTGVISSFVPALIAYVAIIVLVFLIGRRVVIGNITSEQAGLLAAFLAATTLFVVGYATRVLPDLFTGVIATAAVYLFLRAGTAKRQRLAYFAAGALATLTIYVKLIGLAFMLFFFLAAVFMIATNGWDAHRKKGTWTNVSGMHFAWLALGMLLLFMIYLASVYAATGNPLYTVGNYGQFQNSISPSSFAKNIGMLEGALFGYGNQAALLVSPDIAPFGFAIVLAVLGTATGILRRNRKALFLSIILWGVFLYLYFGSISLGSYDFAFVSPRYFDIVIAPIAVLAAYGIIMAYKSARELFGNWAGVATFVILMIMVIASNYPTYFIFYNYNLSIAGSTAAYASMLNYTGTSNVRLLFNTQTPAEFTSFMAGYSNSINITYLNTGEPNVMMQQISDFCSSTSKSSYLAIAYDNYSKLEYRIITDRWPYSTCNITQVGFFYGKGSNSSTYNSFNAEIRLYKVS